MNPCPTFRVLAKKIREKIRQGLFFQVLRDRLAKIGINISPFYWMKESLTNLPPPLINGNPADYTFSFFGINDIETINNLPERQAFNKQVFPSLLDKGKKCFGVKFKGEIAAFTWFDLEKSNSHSYPVAMKDNEAYLFDMYVLKNFRGKNIAPALRHKSYSVLKSMGRDTCYSITEYFNTPSFKFKQKLQARVIFKGLYVNLFKKVQKRWVLRRYSQELL